MRRRTIIDASFHHRQRLGLVHLRHHVIVLNKRLPNYTGHPIPNRLLFAFISILNIRTIPRDLSQIVEIYASLPVVAVVLFPPVLALLPPFLMRVVILVVSNA
jgi:hypothetical protein